MSKLVPETNEAFLQLLFATNIFATGGREGWTKKSLVVDGWLEREAGKERKNKYLAKIIISQINFPPAPTTIPSKIIDSNRGLLTPGRYMWRKRPSGLIVISFVFELLRGRKRRRREARMLQIIIIEC